MNNVQQPNKFKLFFSKRWSAEDYPGAEPRFQLPLLFQDFAVYVFLPILAIILFKSCENAWTAPKKYSSRERSPRLDSLTDDHSGRRSQIIDFTPSNGSGGGIGISKTAAGGLVKVRLLNVVETYSNAPVHAQIVDAGLGKSLIGATIIGDAVPDPTFNRINITFSLVRDNKRSGFSLPISARALSLNGTLGVNGQKKEGFFARAALNSSGSIPPDANGGDSKDLKQILLRALAGGTLQEFSSESQVEKNRAQVLTLKPNTEFYAELTDSFPGSRR